MTTFRHYRPSYTVTASDDSQSSTSSDAVQDDFISSGRDSAARGTSEESYQSIESSSSMATPKKRIRTTRRIAIERQSQNKKVNASKDLISCVRDKLPMNEAREVRGLADAAKKAIMLLDDYQNRESILEAQLMHLKTNNLILNKRVKDLETEAQETIFWKDLALDWLPRSSAQPNRIEFAVSDVEKGQDIPQDQFVYLEQFLLHPQGNCV
ncbi:hypothetical protein SISNIDRAFT_460654 [Sistotremastrum niveocremeum HHB9708]|uniref:Uncharacterized protein n=2 Tax=Sistotremastraceae TaxID=3402574 RepID=A0A164NHZ1_9AGAM|nr:hypothetical protein SISNIDRAFT_460654 [Sistotremastrum niveocremeum HHB9708]KZT35352.1 hypothetical protein SISSUDRAFT_1051515 [Sistotremastrum suecicum HHB10207 ss-3]